MEYPTGILLLDRYNESVVSLTAFPVHTQPRARLFDGALFQIRRREIRRHLLRRFLVGGCYCKFTVPPFPYRPRELLRKQKLTIQNRGVRSLQNLYDRLF